VWVIVVIHQQQHDVPHMLFSLPRKAAQAAFGFSW
jgi:hypothetical protein